jgi:two-component system, OmpR family, response regulator MtrA
MTRILVVEDNNNLRQGLCDMLRTEGLEVVGAGDGAQALEDLRLLDPDLVILDLMLPTMSGIEVLRAIRASSSNVAVLVLTAKLGEDNKVEILGAGADDYVTKPFGRRELIARINALLRRAARTASASPEPEGYAIGDIVIDMRRHEVSRGGRPVALTRMEFDLLVALARRAGGVATRGELLREVWNYGPDVASRTVDLHVMELRRKLEVDATRTSEAVIVTVRKVGYRLGQRPTQ